MGAGTIYYLVAMPWPMLSRGREETTPRDVESSLNFALNYNFLPL